MANRQIIAIGGLGLSPDPRDHALEKYILAQCPKPKPKLAFLGTALGDAPTYHERFYKEIQGQNCEPSTLSLFKPHTRDIEGYLLEQDVIYVGGGNTRNLLILWREWGVDTAIRKAYENGVVLAGWSAGSICWFEAGTTDSWFGPLSPLKCLGWLPGSNSPHYDAEPMRRPAYHEMIQDGRLMPGLAADDGVGFHFVNERLHQTISSRPNGRGWKVELKNGAVHETEIVPELLK